MYTIQDSCDCRLVTLVSTLCLIAYFALTIAIWRFELVIVDSFFAPKVNCYGARDALSLGLHATLSDKIICQLGSLADPLPCLSENSHPHVHIERLMLLVSGIAVELLVPPEVS